MSTPASGSLGGRARRLLELPVHPFLFGAYAVLFLWSQNVSKVRPPDVVEPLLIVLAGTAALFAVGWLVLRDRWRSAILVTVFSFLFFSYGHVFSARNDKLGFAIYAAIGLAALLIVLIVRPSGRRGSLILNAVLALLLMMTGVTIVTGKLAEWREGTPATVSETQEPASTAAASDRTKRDIYFILLDRYAGEKTLKEHYDYDNSFFLDGLRKRGFYVASGSRAPYPKTPHSIQTTLNMEYLDDLPKGSSDWKKVYGRLKKPETAQYAKQQGYKYVLMGSGYHSLRSDPFADVNVTYDPKSGPVFTEFENVLVESTALRVVGEQLEVTALDKRRAWYERALFQFREIPRIAKMREPTFMFSHILITHDPYVFDAKGNFVSAEEEGARSFSRLFTDSITFQSHKTLELLDKLLAGPDEEDPIIVIQADEGPGPKGWSKKKPEHYDWTKAPQEVLEEKFRILNAYYLPGVEEHGLHQTMAPANSFRHIFNLYFDGGFPLLPERSYVFRNELQPYNFIDVTDRVRD